MKKKERIEMKGINAEYERKNQFEKLIAKTVAMKEKMEKIQLAFHKVQGMDDCL